MQGILQRVILVMIENYGIAPEDLQAVISPSLGPCCAEFVNFRQELPEEFQQFMVGKKHFDFWQITRHQLMSAGMLKERIGTAAVCTCCSDDYFSYRRASRLSNGLTGRNCSVILLQTPLKGVFFSMPLDGNIRSCNNISSLLLRKVLTPALDAVSVSCLWLYLDTLAVTIISPGTW